MAPIKNDHEEARLIDALKRLRQLDVPPIDPAREQALLAAFDAHVAAPRTPPARGTFSAAAALATVILALNWTAAIVKRPGDQSPAASFDMEGFVAWPGAEAWPPFESGSVVRVELPVAALSGLGLVAPAPASTLVEADLIVGQDGLTRAVRLVQLVQQEGIDQ